MKVSGLGEFGLIDLLAKMVADAQEGKANYPALLTGIGDDAAAWPGDSHTQLATVDSLIEGIHFNLKHTTWQELGWKALAVNLSDIAAMGGVPAHALVSLGLPESAEVEDITALYAGMLELAKIHRVNLAGGDTCRSPVVMITMTVFGHSRGEMLLRSSARPGDSIAVTGHLGGATAGLDMLTNNRHFSPEAAASLREAFNKPKPRLAEGQLLVKHGIWAAIDISDGLLADLGHICKMSGVGAKVNVEDIPVFPPVTELYADRALELALTGGEDYELLFTGPAATIDKIKTEADCPISIVGEITESAPGEISLVDGLGSPIPISRTGWEHFKKE